jgi:hypothetical protein
MSRNISKATPFMQWFWEVLRETVWQELKLTIFLVDVDRDWKVQRAYYAQGRDDLKTVNYLRSVVGLPPINAVQNKKKITWTMKSKHITNLEDDSTYNDFSRAIDIGLKAEDGRYVGEPGADLNKDSKRDYEQIGAIGERIGGHRIKWGGRFGDMPHFEEV